MERAELLTRPDWADLCNATLPSCLGLAIQQTTVQHFKATPLQVLAQGVVDLTASARITMNVLAPTDVPVASSAPSSYIELFTQIAILQANGDHYGLIEAAERADLTVSPLLCFITNGENSTHPHSPQGNLR